MTVIQKKYDQTLAIQQFAACKNTLSFFLCLMMLFAPLSATAAGFSATVDRLMMQEGESFTLLLKSDESSIFGSPDYTPLEKDFELINNSRSSQTQILNGDTTSSTLWRLTLMPKKNGRLIIPPITFKGDSSQAITINVNTASSSTLTQTNAQIVVETRVDKETVYVQEQAIFTVRLLFQGVQIRKWNLSEPSAGDALVYPLGEAVQYDKTINGISYGVLEKKYALFPQSSQNLEIKPITFTGVISDGNQRRSPFGYSGGRQVIKRSPAVTLTVQSKNPAYPTAHWLPAKAVQIEETWSPENVNFQVGESITRTVKLSVLGQSSATLAPLNFKLPADIKSYPDKPQLGEGLNDSGLVGQRIESLALIPSAAGDFTLPAIKVYWWDTTSDALRQATLPEKTIKVLPAVNNAPATPPPALPHSAEAAITPAVTPNISANNLELEAEIEKWRLSTGILAALLCLCLLMITFIWIRQNKVGSNNTKQVNEAEQHKQLSLKKCTDKLTKACKSNETAEVKVTLINWGKVFYQQDRINSLGQLLKHIENKALSDEIKSLQAFLYSNQLTDTAWPTETLLTLIKNLPSSPKTQTHEKITTLKPLYPS